MKKVILNFQSVEEILKYDFQIKTIKQYFLRRCFSTHIMRDMRGNHTRIAHTFDCCGNLTREYIVKQMTIHITNLSSSWVQMTTPPT